MVRNNFMYVLHERRYDFTGKIRDVFFFFFRLEIWKTLEWVGSARDENEGSLFAHSLKSVCRMKNMKGPIL